MSAIVLAGKTVVCIASGPSLTKHDCDRVKRSGLTTIAVNSSHKLAGFAAIAYAGDKCWWDNYGAAVPESMHKVTCTAQAAHVHKIELHRCYGEYNSGMRAIQYAIEKGAAKVLLLGYDCSLANGKHWHGDHDKTDNPDAVKVRSWHRHFNYVASLAKSKNVQVINCSAYTELKCFVRQELAEALGKNNGQ